MLKVLRTSHAQPEARPPRTGDELMRIGRISCSFATFCMDLGATTMLFYTLRERERILDIFEKTCGAHDIQLPLHRRCD